MPIGPGKYDDITTYVREQTQAGVVMVLVVGGIKGDGFAVQVAGQHAEGAAAVAKLLARALRDVAEQIEKDGAELQAEGAGA